MNKINCSKIDRFLDGQRFGYKCALSEIRNGHKVNHWIWYVFPQLKGLGHSPNSMYYGIDGIQEAKEYVNHPILGFRIKEISSVLLEHAGKEIETIMPGIDAVKLKSCMTLYDHICPYDVYAQVLNTFFKGERDQLTLSMLREP